MSDDASQTQQPCPEPPPSQGGQTTGTPPTQTPAKRSYWAWIIAAAAAIGCLPWLILICMALVGISVGLSGSDSPSKRGDQIALIRISGVITSGRSMSSMFSDSSTGSDDLIDQLERARKNKKVKAIVLRINSPGGSPAAAEEVYKELMRIRRAKKPVYASMADLAASAGYYIAAGSDKIYADESTITGSIGVIWNSADMSGLFKKIGLNPQVIKSGKFKDIGSSNRPITAEEHELLKSIVMDTYDQFVKAVAKGRGLPVEQIKQIADGRVFTGNQAKQNKLVDEIGGMRETVLAAAKAGGIKGEPKVVEYQRRLSLSDIWSGESEAMERVVTRHLIDQLTKNSGSGLR
ncbi:MAG: signal peptide peptidase SppA [Armatimonadetes bacterium]|jgi:protease-4|nr:signal peptide peptidase SppA [Armatimonadota bacterium]